MFNPAYLSISRHYLYYFRYPIPRVFHPQARRTDIKISLNTRCPSEALHIAKGLAYCADTFFTNPEVFRMDYQTIRQVLTDHFKALYKKNKERIARNGQFEFADIQALTNSMEHAEDALKGDTSFYGDDDQINMVMKQLDVSVERHDQQYEVFRKEFLKSFRDYCKQSLKYNSSFDEYSFDTPYINSLKKLESQKKALLRDKVDKYISEESGLRKWTQKTKDEIESSFRLLLEYLGNDVDVNLSQDVANDVKTMLIKIPKQARTNPKYKDKTIKELINMSHNDRLSSATIRKYMQTYSGFFEWALRRKDVTENNFKEINVKVVTEEKREAFTAEQIQMIFDEIGKFPKGLFKKSYQKWGILIAFYTGARLEEIAQMELVDIKQIDGIWCFSINDDGDKRLKTKSSKRNVPIHSKLIELDILGYVKECETENHKRLLHELRKSGKNGYGRNLSRWFNESLLVKLGIKKDVLVLHSFRHTISAELLKAGVEEPIVSSITGHSLNSVTQKHYGKGYKISQLKEAIEKFQTDNN